MKPFDLCHASLEPGTTLIEASAGTGKTYSITGLMLRFLLEEAIPIGQIVAVTFTEAATKELRDRTRSRVASALHDLSTGQAADPILQAFLQNGDAALGVQRLNLALQCFDEAQIFTIHGFCQRCLADHAFESGAQFDTKLSADATPFLEQVAHDFWRRHFDAQTSLTAAAAIAWEQSPKRWVKLLDRLSSHPDLVVLPASDPATAGERTARIAPAYAAVCREWQQQRAEIEQVLLESQALLRSEKNFPVEQVRDLLAQIAPACAPGGAVTPEALDALRAFRKEAIADGTRKASAPLELRFFDLCTEFCAAATAYFDGLIHELRLFAQTELPRRKALANTVTFDDLILNLRGALAGISGARLGASIGRRYRAVLIDEFQDTDPAQYEIFQALFAHGRHALFYIGDPKQAIFGFRGADIFTYRQAARASTHQACTLTTNWRSEAKLLRGLNALFGQAARPFAFDWIEYHQVQPPPQPRVVPLLRARRAAEAALRLRLLPAPAGGKDLSAPEASAAVMARVAADITGLYAGGAALADRPLRYRDTAVLVRKNSQAEEMQAVLRGAGIRSILRTESSVFSAPEAEELDRFLQGVLEPRRRQALKGALATSLLGLDAQALHALDTDDQQRQEWLEWFLELQAQWVDGCFIAMFRRLLVDKAVRGRLVRLSSGERRLTNFLQLAELLHEAETARHLSPDAVCAFLHTLHANERTAEEHYQLRLESDEDAVHIVTVHKAKGLEYPIVFCPFLWQSAENKNRQELLFHDRQHDDRLTLDLRGKKDGDPLAREWQSEENRAEELRLAYVALTRAMNRCYVYIPAAQKILESPLAHLLGAGKSHPIGEGIARLVLASKGAVDAVEATDVEPGQRQLPGGTPPLLAARVFTGRIPHLAMSASFTGLNTEVELDPEIPAADLEEEPDTSEPAVPVSNEPSIFTFPRGAQAGDFFHDVLENVNLPQPGDELETLVTAKLRLHGIAQGDFGPIVSANVRASLEVELAPGVRLSAAAPGDVSRELGFTYPLRRLTPAGFRAVLAQCPDIDGAVAGRMGRLQFQPVEGFMRGFIDVLFRCQGRFYVMDWKSNWLGAKAGDYTPGRLRAEMLHRNYYLQYHLYTLAADLFLRQRLPGYRYERDFGGVFYVFLRGVDPRHPRQGVFADRPAARTLAALHRLLP
jgi:exodeoxyribonuclease V beta subunit